jgi:hypothetical protein
MTLIDLDEPVARPEPTPRRRSRLAVAGLVLVVIGGAGGALATDRWRTQRQLDRARSAVSVVLLPDPLQHPDDSTAVDAADGTTVTQVELTGHVDMVNAGPAPVRFVGFSADRAGLRLHGDGPATPGPTAPGPAAAGSTAPGDFVVGTLHATVACASRPPSEALPAVVEVESADGVLRRPTVLVEWRPWADRIAAVCANPPPGRWSRR